MNKYSSSLSFIDFLFNLLLVFVSLFILSFILINPEKQNKKIDPKAEFLIILSWDQYMPDDVDLWVEDPRGNIVFFQKKESGLMHLDRDDLGMLNDKITTEDGAVEFSHNQEIVSLRGTFSGEYVVNVHMYAKNIAGANPVDIQIIKLNPFYIVHNDIINLSSRGQEETVCRFILDDKGNFVSKNKMPKSLINPRNLFRQERMTP